MTDYYLFDGGNYKRGIDDGHIRKPLNPAELQVVHRDPDVPHTQLDNAITGQFHMDKFDNMLSKLAVDDAIYLAILPDATVYRGLWFLPQTSYPDLDFEAQLVDATEVHGLYCEGKPTTTATTYGPKLDVTLDAGLGDATCDAISKQDLWGGELTDYRNPAAFQGGLFEDQFLAGLHKAMYLRLTITSVPASPVAKNCKSCKESTGMPLLQWGVIIDDIGVFKQFIADYCNCEKKFCAGCGEKPCDDNC
jgi:hypothetical protein